MDRRVLPGLSAGLVGGLAGVTAAMTGSRLLALAAGLAAVGAGAAAGVLAARLWWLQRQPRHQSLSDPPAPGPAPVGEPVAQVVAAAPAMSPTAAAPAPALAPSTAAAAAAGPVAGGGPGPEAGRGPESVFDPETGLLDERVFVVSFERKVAAARRHLRPLCLVLLDVASGLPGQPSQRRRSLEQFGVVVRDTLRDADIACRLGATAFGLILEDTPEAGGVWAAERLQIAMACNGRSPTRMVAAVAAYPNHGLAAQDVLQRAQEALVRARNSDVEGMGPVEVATIDLG